LGDIPFYLLSVIFFYKLAYLITPSRRILATCVFAFSPVVFVNSLDIMLDVPIMFFSIATFYFLAKSTQKTDVFFAGLFTVFACLTKFTGGTLLIAGIIYYLLSKKWKELFIFCLIFFVFYGLWIFHNIFFWGKIQILSSGHAHYIINDIRYRFERLVSYFGGTITLGIFPFLLGFLLKKFRFVSIIISIFLFLWSLLLLIFLKFSIGDAAFYFVCASGGIILILVTIKYLLEKKMPIYYALLSHFIFQLIGGLFLTLYASRYMLTFTFLGIFTLVWMLEQINSTKIKQFFYYSIIISSLTISLLLAIFSMQFAYADKNAALEVLNKYKGYNIFYGGRMGYLYYFNKAGFKNLLFEKPALEDILVKNAYSSDDNIFFKNMKLDSIEHIKYNLIPLRSIGGRAGFYGNDRLPFAWICEPKEKIFMVYKKK